MGRCWKRVCDLCCGKEEEDHGHKVVADGAMHPGTGVLHVDLGNKRIMRVFYYLPEADRFDPDRTPVHFVIHGMQRNAHHVFDGVLKGGEAQRLGIILLCPLISHDLFPKRRGFNFGNVFSKDVARWQEHGHHGLPRTNHQNHWSFTAIETVFDAVRAGCGSRAETYSIFGHSAGAQFVHRFALLYGAFRREGDACEEYPFRARTLFCANAGWWTMPHFRGGPFREEAVFPFPYGLDMLHKSHETRDQVAAAFAKLDLVVLLGELDTDPRVPDPKAWEDSPGATAQGPHRLARGHAFFQAGQALSRHLGTPCHWSEHVVPGVGHDCSLMALIAIRYLFDHEKHRVIDTSFVKDYHGEVLD